MKIELTIQLQNVQDAVHLKVDTLEDLGIRNEMWDNLSELGRQEELRKAAVDYLKIQYREL